MENIMEEIYQTAHDKNILLSLMIELLTECNEKCVHCYIPKHNNTGLSLDKLKDIIIQFRKLGGLNLSLTGGEIFLRNDIFELISFARKNFLRVFLLTNASLITENVAIKLKELYISELSVSVYSLVPEIHDCITGVKGSLESTLLGLSFAKKYGIPVTVKTPLMEINKNSYINIKKYCEENNFAFIASTIIFAKSNGDKKVKSLTINDKELPSIFNDIKEFEPKGKRNDFEEACGSLKYMLAIDSEGNIYPCNSLFYKVGNIKQDSLHKIWVSEKLKRIQNIKKTELIKCKNCKIKEKCNRCPGLALLEDGDIWGCSSTAKKFAEIRL